MPSRRFYMVRLDLSPRPRTTQAQHVLALSLQAQDTRPCSDLHVSPLTVPEKSVRSHESRWAALAYVAARTSSGLATLTFAQKLYVSQELKATLYDHFGLEHVCCYALTLCVVALMPKCRAQQVQAPPTRTQQPLQQPYSPPGQAGSSESSRMASDSTTNALQLQAQSLQPPASLDSSLGKYRMRLGADMTGEGETDEQDVRPKRRIKCAKKKKLAPVESTLADANRGLQEEAAAYFKAMLPLPQPRPPRVAPPPLPPVSSLRQQRGAAGPSAPSSASRTTSKSASGERIYGCASG